MAIPTFVSQSSAASAIGSTTPGVPAGIANDDILIYVVETADEALATATGATPPNVAAADSGWTQLAVSAAAGTTRLSMYWKRTTGTETMPQTGDGASNNNHQLARCFAFRGALASGNPFIDTPVTDQDNVGSSTAFTCPAIVTTTNDSLVLQFCSSDFDGTNTSSGHANASLSGFSVLTDSSFTSSGNGGGWVGMYGGLATAGNSGTATGTFSSGCSQARITAALASTAGGGGGTARGMPIGNRGTAFNGGRTFQGPIN